MASHRDYEVHVKRSITIGRKPEELYREWHQPKKLGCFVPGVKSVRTEDDLRSFWKADIPGIGVETWESEITEDRENEAIEWQTTGRTGFKHRGKVTFMPRNGQKTEVTLELDARIPGGIVGNTVRKLTGHSPEDYVSGTLHNFKQLMETGGMASSRGPVGRARILNGVGPKVAVGTLAAAMVAAGVVYARRASSGER